MATDVPEPVTPGDVLKMNERQLLTHLLLSVNDLTTAIREVSVQLDDRPTREEVAQQHEEARAEVVRQRKRAIARMVSGIAAVLMLFVFTQDAHVEYCGPGARSEKIVNAIMQGEIQTTEDFQRLADRAAPAAICDAMVPLHTHDHATGWPSAWNIVGVIFYGLVGIASAWGLTTRRWNRAPD